MSKQVLIANLYNATLFVGVLPPFNAIIYSIERNDSVINFYSQRNNKVVIDHFVRINNVILVPHLYNVMIMNPHATFNVTITQYFTPCNVIIT